MTLPPRPFPFAILVVEDEPLILQLVLGYLRALGVTAYGASGASRAEQLLREHDGEIGGAVIDLCMPEADGVETRRRLARVKPGLPCCLMSGSGLSAGPPPEGFCHVLDKPFGLAQLRDCLDVMCPRSLPEGEPSKPGRVLSQSRGELE